MKKIIIALNLVIIAMAATASGRNNLFSLFKLNPKQSENVTAKAHKAVAGPSFETLKSQYEKGAVSADSLINYGVHQMKDNPSLAESCLKLAASNGNQKANDYLGFFYFQQKDYDTAKKYLESKADHEGFAYTALGSMFLEGKGVREDGAKARENYHKGALKGYSRGMTLYANLLGTKNGGALDYPDAFLWHYIAGELGENLSRVTLFRPMLPQAPATDEVGQDAQQALLWIEKVHTGMKLQDQPIYKEGFLKGLKESEKAADAGDDWARFYLGSMNYNGDFLNQNYPQAIRYYDQIVKNGKLPAPVMSTVKDRLAEMQKSQKKN